MNSWPSDWIGWLLLVYVLLLPFTQLLELPVVKTRLQPTELVFWPLLVLGCLRYGFRLWQIGFWGRTGVLGYLATNFLAAFYSGATTAVLEACGRAYLLVLALIVAAYVQERGVSSVEKLLRFFLYGTGWLALIAYCGYLAAALGFANDLVQVYGNYPYLGTVLRAKGLTSGAGMLIVVLQLPLLYAWWGWRSGKLSWGWWAFLLPLAGLTFAKEFLLLGLGLVLVTPGFIRRGRRMQGPLLTVFALIFWLGTHLIVQPRQPVEASSLNGTNYTSNELVWRGENWQLLETSYLALKKAGLRMATEHPVVGVGPGQFGKELPALKATGEYPKHLPNYDPHSTWLGALTETGSLGLLALALLLGSLYRRFSRLGGREGPVRCCLVFLGLILIMSVSKDVANYRFVWLIIGALLGLTNPPSPKSPASDRYSPPLVQ